MNLDTAPAERTVCNGEINLMSSKYFPNEDLRTFRLESVHGPKYQKTCNSCQAGVTYIKQAFEYLNKGYIIWNQNIVEQTQDRIVILIGSYRREFLLNQTKVCVVPVEPTVENLLQWFVQQFKGQLELAHTNILTISSENDMASVQLGY